MTDNLPAMLKDARKDANAAIDQVVNMRKAIERFCQEVCFWRPYDTKESCVPDCPLYPWKGE